MAAFCYNFACNNADDLYCKLLSTPFDFQGLKFSLLLSERRKFEEAAIMAQFLLLGAIYDSVIPEVTLADVDESRFQLTFIKKAKETVKIEQKKQIKTDSIVVLDSRMAFMPLVRTFAMKESQLRPHLPRSQRDQADPKADIVPLIIKADPSDRGYCEHCQISFIKAKIHKSSRAHQQAVKNISHWKEVDEIIMNYH